MRLSAMTTAPERRTATLSELVAEEIRAQMGRKRMTQAQLARGISKTEMWVSLRLRGKQPLDMNDLLLIARELGVGVHDLLPPPEVAAKAVVRSVIGDYLPMPVRADKRTLPHLPIQHNRPPARRDSTHPGGERRTTRVTRGGDGRSGGNGPGGR